MALKVSKRKSISSFQSYRKYWIIFCTLYFRFHASFVVSPENDGVRFIIFEQRGSFSSFLRINIPFATKMMTQRYRVLCFSLVGTWKYSINFWLASHFFMEVFVRTKCVLNFTFHSRQKLLKYVYDVLNL